MQDKNSNPPILFCDANSESFLSVTALPDTIMSFGNIEILENLFPNLIKTPSNKLSLMRIFEPAPKIKIFSILLNSLRNKTNSFKLSGLKYTLVFPPILNQLVFFKL